MATLTLIFGDDAVRRIEAEPFETIYQAAQRQGIDILTDCREGACATCKARCSTGDYLPGDYSDEALGDDEAAAGGVLLCQTIMLSDGVVELPYALEALDLPPAVPVAADVVAVDRVAASVHRLVLRPETPVDYLAGQYARIELPDGGARAYSFATPPGGDLEFYVRHLVGGLMSEWLAGPARAGDRLRLTAPLGQFHLRTGPRPVLMVAGGTGLAPLLAMLDERAGSATALVGARRRDDLFGEDILAASGADVRLALEDPLPGWQGHTGRVTDLIADALPLSGEVEAYLCGPPAMIDAARADLVAGGVPEARIHAERFLPSA